MDAHHKPAINLRVTALVIIIIGLYTSHANAPAHYYINID